MFSFRNQCLVNSDAEQNGIDGHWMKISPPASPCSSSGEVHVSNSFSFDSFLAEPTTRSIMTWCTCSARTSWTKPVAKSNVPTANTLFPGRNRQSSFSALNKLKSSCVQATSLKSDNGDFILSLFAFSNFTTVETEQLIYPLSSLVKFKENSDKEI